MKAFKLFIIYFTFLLFVGCERNDKDLLVGDIIGKVEIYDENNYLLQERSNVDVSLIDDTTAIYSSTNQVGQFNFENIQYGNYQIDLVKEGFVKSINQNFVVNHLGGYSPTLINYYLFEIPKFELLIDSFDIALGPNSSYAYLSLTGNSDLPYKGYMLIFFFGQTPEVSRDNYIFHVNGFIRSDNIFDLYTRASLGYIRDDLLLKSDSVYFRVYPQANGQQMYEFYPESLGKPSNVVSFLL